jgi:uncharacterized protein YegP (UPF0339 family)
MSRPLVLSLAALIVAAAGWFALLAVPRPVAAADADKADKADKKSAATFEMYKDKAGEYRWRLRTRNTQVIATSGQGYSSKRACEEGIESVKKNAPDAAVQEKEGDATGGAKE